MPIERNHLNERLFPDGEERKVLLIDSQKITQPHHISARIPTHLIADHFVNDNAAGAISAARRDLAQCPYDS